MRLSFANRCGCPGTSLAGTECLDIFSPAPGDREVISQALRDSSIETKIAPRSVRIAACAGRGASLSIIGSRVGASATSLSRSAGRQPNTHRIYLLTLKANHGRAFEAVRGHFERTCFCRGASGRPACDAFDDSHGRLARRRVFVSPAPKELEPLHGWPDLRTLLAVETIRSVNGTNKTETEIRYFLTSCEDDPAVLAQAIRRHWSIENSLHWVLDVTFREDDSRVRDRTAARNLALLRKIALNLVAADRSSQTSVRGRRKKAAWNDDYMLRIITRQVHA